MVVWTTGWLLALAPRGSLQECGAGVLRLVVFGVAQLLRCLFKLDLCNGPTTPPSSPYRALGGVASRCSVGFAAACVPCPDGGLRPCWCAMLSCATYGCTPYEGRLAYCDSVSYLRRRQYLSTTPAINGLNLQMWSRSVGVPCAYVSGDLRCFLALAPLFMCYVWGLADFVQF